jgi:hypothetical protein
MIEMREIDRGKQSIAHLAFIMRTCGRLLLPGVLLPLLLLTACTAFGPKRVQRDRFNYNEALSGAGGACKVPASKPLVTAITVSTRDVRESSLDVSSL